MVQCHGHGPCARLSSWLASQEAQEEDSGSLCKHADSGLILVWISLLGT